LLAGQAGGWSLPGEDDLLAPFQLKGLTGSRIPVGTRVNEAGETEHIYEIQSDPEWGETTNSQQATYAFEYAMWHQTYHAKPGYVDSRCTICGAEQKFRQERAPHDMNHKGRGQYDPSCRFCQDDKFFGRM
jgi:hypothetical protein